MKDALYEKLQQVRSMVSDLALSEPEPWPIVGNPGKRIIGLSFDIFDDLMSELYESRRTIERLRQALEGLDKARQ